MGIYIDVAAKAREVELLERKLYLAKMELCSAECMVDYCEAMDMLDTEVEYADEYAALKSKRGDRRRATKKAKARRKNLAKSIYGSFYDEISDFMSDNDLLRSNHNYISSGRKIRKSEKISDCYYDIPEDEPELWSEHLKAYGMFEVCIHNDDSFEENGVVFYGYYPALEYARKQLLRNCGCATISRKDFINGILCDTEKEIIEY